ncbi:NADPH-dependent ferric siderophore reductase [Neorhizobium huautlense]|uniref:NADPH-dependent ferric siderophore reductase n=1 Tax=Neorhizobium huautlense TaxID=67774 RepID=A0ABT9Q1T3_9HYPH|nr:siderophore-interacting protein [Neorhizobium huautlense]MDP9840079.1 NADPH-dependent ferric siderophore reductase [Neorhizobium huautlense]
MTEVSGLLSATTKVICPDAVRLGRIMTEHLVEHGNEIVPVSETVWTLSSSSGDARIIADGGSLRIETSAPDAEMLLEMKYLLASHLGEFNHESGADILWQGDGEEIASLPNLRSLKVLGIRDLSPHIRRITFGSSKLKRFNTPLALHAKLLFPRDHAPLCLPSLTPIGTIDWGSDEERAIIRKYTIRRIDPQSGTLDIDFVLHDHGGPGSRFAANAKVGDVLGMIGPGGGSARPADWNLFAGDETALPAIARLIEALPADARGKAIIEVADERDEQPICCSTGIDIAWLHRSRSASPNELAERVSSVRLPSNGSVFAWAGTEFSTFRKIRSDWRSFRRLPKEDHLAVSYWRDGHAQT